ncbi:MAG: FtsX-like permease family protein [Lachnospiraceae bacterium]|nr:FtsX-like permease family protein [Lachnospiraceae bacterium]
MMKRTTVREIKQSLGRYLAIFAIVALGVGFFAGLKVTKEAMVDAVDQYLKDADFYDLRLLSNLGFEKEDVEAFGSEENVKAVEGAIFADVLYRNREGNEAAIKVHSITENINRLVLMSGRMPENATECVVDSNLYTEGDIGTTVTFSENNLEDTKELFHQMEYTIVGIVQSPYYMNFERGNTSIGNGKITGFLYLPEDAFDCDYYTEVFVKLTGDYQIYSGEYKDFIEKAEDIWEPVCEERVYNRYEEIIQDANKEIEDAEKELADKKDEGEKELADAWKEIQDGEQEIKDGQEEISKNQQNIDSQRSQLNSKEKELEEQKAAVAQQIQQIGTEIPQLAETNQQIEEGLSQIAAGKARLDSAQKTLDEKKEELQKAEADLQEGKADYEKAQTEFDEKIAEAEEKIKNAKEELAKVEEPDYYVLSRASNIGYVCFESDSSIVEGIANVFPLFFFLVAALVCITTMNRMVEEQRTQIGVLKALGYGEGAIMGKYMFYAGSGAVSGCILGFFAGTYLFPAVIWTSYRIMYNTCGISYVFNGWILFVSLVVSLLCSIGTTWLSCRYELFSVAAELMRPKAPRAGKRILLEKIPFVWKRLKFLHKVSIRNLFRYKKRFFMMVIGISGCTALLVTGFGIKDSIADVAIQQFEEIQIFQMSASLKEEMEEETEHTGSLEEVLEAWSKGYCQVYESSMDMIGTDKIKAINLVIAKEEESFGDYVSLHTVRNEAIPYPEKGEIIISNNLADIFHLKVGDRVTLRDEQYKEIQAKVSGIFENYVYNYVYLNKETYKECYGREPEYKTLYINIKEGKDTHEASAALMDKAQVSAVVINKDTMERFRTMMESLNYIVLLIIVCAGSLAFIVLYNLTNINITERIREIATIKVLGFFKNETASYVFRENMVLTAIGALLGLFLGKLLHAFVMLQIQIDMVSFDVHIKPLSYVYSLLFTFGFTAVVNLFMSHKLEKINMAESLKSVD